MIALLFTISFSIAFAIFSTQNTSNVTIHVAQYSFEGLALYIVILGSLLVGVVVATVFHYLSSISTFFILRKKELVLKELKKTIAELIRRVHVIELEMEKEKEKNGEQSPLEKNAL